MPVINMIDLKHVPKNPGCVRIINSHGRFAGGWWDASLVGGGLIVKPSVSLCFDGYRPVLDSALLYVRCRT